MKKILSIFVLLLSTIVGLSANDSSKEFTQKQLSMRRDIVKYLIDEGFKARTDKDGDIKFDYKNERYYMIINDKWEEPFCVSLYNESWYDNKDYTKNNLKNCITAVAQHKIVKLNCRDSVYVYRAEVIFKQVEVLKKSFYLMLNEIEAAKKDVHTILSSGLGGIDIANDKEAVWIKALSYYIDEEYSKSFPLFKYLSENEYGKSYGYMGLAYELGEGVTKDDTLMKKYYEKAMEVGFSWCAYRLGNYYYKNTNYAEALNYYIKCGSSDNSFRSEALYSAGKMYENGEGTDRSITKAITCYKKSVQYATELECDARLALMRLGETIERESDFVEATEDMLIGLTPADMYNSGEGYEFGLSGRNVSLTKAYAYYKAAADKGYAKAQSKMGEIYISKFYPFKNKDKSDKYYSKAIKNYKKRVTSDGSACYELGYMYHNGFGVEKNMEQAIYYYKSGALLGDINSLWRMGLIYKDEMEYDEAFKYFLKAADGGQGMAMFELAALYENGLGTPMNKDRAIEWYKKCSKSNYKARHDANKALERLEYNEDKI